MKRIFSITATLAAVSFTSGCATQGDPTQGGLFGWSQGAYQQREAEKVNYLRGIQEDTARRQERADDMSRDVDAQRSRLR